jgi:phosphatidate cytidylyltransferase
MLKTRVITGLILGTLLLLGIFLLKSPWIELAFGLVFSIAAWEWAGFGGLTSPAARSVYTGIVAAALWMAWRYSGDAQYLILTLSVACLWWVAAFFWLSVAPARHRAGLTLLCGLLVLVPAFVALVRVELGTYRSASGPQWVLWLILMVCAADIGAYFAGRALGKRKLAPRVSPGKTWEGALGGMAGVALMAWAGADHFGLPAFAATAFGCLIGIFSIVGDLTESMFKRAAALKDSGTLLPGHGGLLDRLDSVTAAAPLYALGLFGAGVLR